MLNSSYFGQFDPMEPAKIQGVFAANIYAEPIEIDAPIETVWEIMTDFDRYPEWNPLNRFFKLDSKAEPNCTVTFGPSWGPYDLSENGQFTKPDMTAHETLTIFEKNCCLAYADIRSYLKAERVQYIKKLESGKTRYHTYERTSGLLSPIVRYKYGAKIIAGFTANGLALKKRAEDISGSHGI